MECAARGQFIDVIQTSGIVVIALALIVTAYRFMRAIDLAAEKIKTAIGRQQEIQTMIERMWKRVEMLETQAKERNAILPTSRLRAIIRDTADRLERLEQLTAGPGGGGGGGDA
jgi:hypothetical protein